MNKKNIAALAAVSLFAVAMATTVHATYTVRTYTPGGTNSVVTITSANQNWQPVQIITHIAGAGTVTNDLTTTFVRGGISWKTDEVTDTIRATDVAQWLNYGTNVFSPVVITPGDQWKLTNTGSAVGSNVYYRVTFKVLD